ncbi:MAG: ATP-binding protein [Candidatus Diapherotrites archaeon]|uniref:ATP-binding protein n=1 Tax=Candidatus Iainarchaeum sp. TaxID=3101447 RepID=A0A8T3YLH9_9ARCH|nr:ATP-binding protein [Candidatus Diapherotrites archaeon]
MPDFLKLSSTKDVPVPKLLLEQIVGQENAAELIRKAAVQRRNVLLVGLPGTGKSMIAKAMSEIMPVQKLLDVLVYPNDEDQNNPAVKSVKAGDGQRILEQARLESRAQDDNMRVIGIILPMGWFLLSYVIWALKLVPDVVYAATLILGGFLMIGFALGSQMRMKVGIVVPKLLVNNAGKKVAPFFEATGARAGALLGDVRHDPLQCHYGFNELYIKLKNKKEGNSAPEFMKKPFAELWDEMRQKYPKEIIKVEKGYEAIMLPAEEKIYTLGYKNGKPVLSRILSLNRRSHEGELVDISLGQKKISLTPEHKVDVSDAEKEAAKISAGDRLIKLIREQLLAIAK